MYLVETHNIKSSNKYFKLIDHFAFMSKNLYNAANYQLRWNNFGLHNNHLNYFELEKLMKKVNDGMYYKQTVSAKVSQQVIKKLEENWALYYKLNREYYKNPNKFTGRPKPPKYLRKSSRFEMHFTNQNFRYRDGYILFPNKLMNFKIKTNVELNKIVYVKIVPVNRQLYKVLVGYTAQESKPIVSNNFAAIDLGINNLATITFTNREPIIINGKPLKSINQYYNKILSKIQSCNLSNYYIENISNKHANKINDYLHKASRYIVNQLVDNNISTLIVGYNKGWKQDTKMSKVNNQNFIQIPFLRFINMLKYKCKLAGIALVTINEAYTSKCLFLDKEEIVKHSNYLGKRINRGLYQTYLGKVINSDVNGSANILRKYLNEFEKINIYLLIDSIEAVVLQPTRINIV